MNQSNQNQTPTQGNATNGRLLTKSILTDATGRAYAVEFKFAAPVSQTRVLYLADMAEDVQIYAMAHGVSQKLGDKIAKPRNPETGLSWSAHEKFSLFVEDFDRLKAGGTWNAERGTGAGADSYLFKALCRLYEGKKSPEFLREWLNGKTPSDRKKLSTENPRIASLIAEIRAEAAGDTEAPALPEEWDLPEGDDPESDPE